MNTGEHTDTYVIWCKSKRTEKQYVVTKGTEQEKDHYHRKVSAYKL